MADSETVTDYLIRAENIITALREAGETMSDGQIVAIDAKRATRLVQAASRPCDAK